MSEQENVRPFQVEKSEFHIVEVPVEYELPEGYQDAFYAGELTAASIHQ
jgi:hypothetical protein